VGTDQVDYGVWNWPENMDIPNGATHVLETHPFLFSGHLADRDIYNTTQEPVQQYHAWTDLTVEDVTVHAGPDPGASDVEMAARRNVHITDEFHAQFGSTLHIRTLETFPECGADAFKSLLMEPQAAAPLALKETPAGPSRLELHFLPVETGNTVRVFPNPFRDAVVIYTDGFDGPMQMEVLDGLGRVVYRESSEGPRTVLSLPQLAPGPYQLLVQQGQQSRSHTLIKQP